MAKSKSSNLDQPKQHKVSFDSTPKKDSNPLNAHFKKIAKLANSVLPHPAQPSGAERTATTTAGAKFTFPSRHMPPKSATQTTPAVPSRTFSLSKSPPKVPSKDYGRYSSSKMMRIVGALMLLAMYLPWRHDISGGKFFSAMRSSTPVIPIKALGEFVNTNIYPAECGFESGNVVAPFELASARCAPFYVLYAPVRVANDVAVPNLMALKDAITAYVPAAVSHGGKTSIWHSVSGMFPPVSSDAFGASWIPSIVGSRGSAAAAYLPSKDFSMLVAWTALAVASIVMIATGRETAKIPLHFVVAIFTMVAFMEHGRQAMMGSGFYVMFFAVFGAVALRIVAKVTAMSRLGQWKKKVARK